MNAFALQEYHESGLDIHMFDEDDVAIDGSGIAYDEAVNAIQKRGVDKVALIGYSHGGGSAYFVSWRLAQNTIAGSGVTDITNPFTVPFTGYIDAIRNTWWGHTDSEDRRPLLTQFHCAQYQRNWHLYPWLLGAPSGGDDDIDRSYRGVSHLTIDDDPIVQDLLRTRLRQNVPK